MNPYRPEPSGELDPEPPRPVGCPCGTSIETRRSYAPLGGWWHTQACDLWRAWAKRNNVCSICLARPGEKCDAGLHS